MWSKVGLLCGWLVTAICLGFGLIQPLFSLTKFWFFENHFVILEGVSLLWEEQVWLLWLALLLFSVLIPCAKLLSLLWLIWQYPYPSSKVIKGLHLIGRWSMVDVFLVALLVAVVKFKVFADVSVLSGLYYLKASIIGTILLTSILEKSASK
jgi:paraquat-inducible protein A